jgi:hypothetical protein
VSKIILPDPNEIHFLLYQEGWILDKSPLRIIQKSRQVGITSIPHPWWVGTHSTCVPDRAPTADSRGCPAFQPPIAADSCGSRSPISGPTGTYRHLSAAIGTKIKISHEHLGKIGKEMVNHLQKSKIQRDLEPNRT